MMNKTLSTFFVLALVLGASSAHAVVGKGFPGEHEHARSVSWDEFRARCQNPEQFDVQRAPQNIRIQCTDIQTEFVSDKPGTIPLSNSRRVMSSMFSDKFSVGGADPIEVPMAARGGSCLRFREVQKVLTLERPLTCADVLGIKGSLEEFCISSTAAAKGANPKLTQINATGRVIDTCSNFTTVE